MLFALVQPGDVGKKMEAAVLQGLHFLFDPDISVDAHLLFDIYVSDEL